MANHILRNLLSRCRAAPMCSFSKTRLVYSGCRKMSYSMDKFDPPYLEAMKPKIPVYEAINVQIKGYDFALVESYQSLVHNVAKMMELDVEECWATPATNSKVNRYKPLTAVIDAEYLLNTYERNVQVLDLPATVAPVFMELLQAALPQGITITLHPHSEDHEEIRYVPDYELDELKTQLDSITPKKKPPT